jgi:hypothetical protein
MTEKFNRLRQRGIFASLQTLPIGFKACLSQAGREPCWGVGATGEIALSEATKEWERKYALPRM